MSAKGGDFVYPVSRYTHRFLWLRRLDEKPMTKQLFYGSVHRRNLVFAQKFISDFLIDGYLSVSAKTGLLTVTSKGRRLLYDWDRRREETARYILTTAIAVAALIISILA